MQITVTIPDPGSLTPEMAAATLATVDDTITQLADHRARLQQIANAPALIEQAAADYLHARDGQPPQQGSHTTNWPTYRQPAGAHDAYPAGYVIRDGNRLFRATRTGVAHPPADSPQDWQDVTAELAGQTPPPTPTAEPWAAGQTVKPGDLRQHDGLIYRCIQGHTTQTGWDPPATPALWVVVP